ncbi:histidine phosphatase family protein [Jannaschia sp. Os4]|uniref:histidine phosphatase family protein n=1 Tax=Jannaschia sp. Os4 TaxID=2807617 RepID=UPI00193985D8|nr:histidine phosphatase family protein [Jannaschia sp. Os4]MBM2576856.1 histidine phosphatase family protein [Jannaschia sp. Os4]
MPLYLMRHGETAWNVEGRMQGRRDSPLTPRGEAQARALGGILVAHGLSGLPCLASPAGRATRTAALAGLAATVLEDLSEIGMGRWEGRLRSDLTASDGVRWKLDAPGGEGRAFAGRVARLAVALPRPALVVTHGMVLIGLRAALRGQGPEAWDGLDDPQGVVFRADEGGEAVLR